MTQPAYIRDPHEKNPTILQCANEARHLLTPLESCFKKEARTRWPAIHWRHYHPVTIRVHEQPSTWYAPFLCVEKKLIVVIQDREDFPYRIYGQNRDLYGRHGYTVLDFSEDFSTPWNQTIWNEAMMMVNEALTPRRPA